MLLPTQLCDSRDTLFPETRARTPEEPEGRATTFLGEILALSSSLTREPDVEPPAAAGSDSPESSPTPVLVPNQDGSRCFDQSLCTVANWVRAGCQPIPPGTLLSLLLPDCGGSNHEVAVAAPTDKGRQQLALVDSSSQTPATGQRSSAINPNQAIAAASPDLGPPTDQAPRQDWAEKEEAAPPLDVDHEAGGPFSILNGVAGTASPDEGQPVRTMPLQMPFDPRREVLGEASELSAVGTHRRRHTEEEETRQLHIWPPAQAPLSEAAIPRVKEGALPPADPSGPEAGRSSVADCLVPAQTGQVVWDAKEGESRAQGPLNPAQGSHGHKPEPPAPIALSVILAQIGQTIDEVEPAQQVRRDPAVSRPDTDPVAFARASAALLSHHAQARSQGLGSASLSGLGPVGGRTADAVLNETLEAAGPIGLINAGEGHHPSTGRFEGYSDSEQNRVGKTPQLATAAGNTSLTASADRLRHESETRQNTEVEDMNLSTSGSRSVESAEAPDPRLRAAAGETLASVQINAGWGQHSAASTRPEPAAPRANLEDAPAPPLPDLPGETLTKPGASARRVEITVAHPESDKPVSLEMTDIGGDVLLNVRTPDTPLRNELQWHVSELIDRLERSGYTAEATERTNRDAVLQTDRARGSDLLWKDGGKGGQRHKGEQQAYQQWMEEKHQGAPRRRR